MFPLALIHGLEGGCSPLEGEQGLKITESRHWALNFTSERIDALNQSQGVEMSLEPASRSPGVGFLTFFCPEEGSFLP